MPDTRDTTRSASLAPQEWLFLGLIVLGWALFVISIGKDLSWDFRNYHWYAPYAFLNGRAALDVAVAHQATYYNPLLDIPFYLLATHTHSWVALGALGAMQGLNSIPLYLMTRSILRIEEKRLASGIVTLLCMTGGLTMSLSGTTYYDNIMSVFVLTGLALLITQRETLATGSLAHTAAIAGIAGLLTGGAMGLKLPEAPYAMGFAAALIALPGDLQHRSIRVFAGGVAGVIGVALFAGYWMVHLVHVTGNPLFPYFNQYFHSPLALAASYRDVRFLPHDFFHASIYPLLFSLDWRVADDLPYTDIRVGIAYVVLIVSAAIFLLGKRAREPFTDPEGARGLFAFVAVSYIVWISMFGIYRYIITLEMLAPLVIVAALGNWPMSKRARLTTLGVLGAAALATTSTAGLERAPLGDPYIQVKLPPIPHPDNTIILMTGVAPMGFMAPTIPHQIPILRIDGWMIQPQDGSRLTDETKARVAAFKGDLFVLTDKYELDRSRAALAGYGLAVRWLECADIENNLAGQYQMCPVDRRPDAKP